MIAPLLNFTIDTPGRALELTSARQIPIAPWKAPLHKLRVSAEEQTLCAEFRGSVRRRTVSFRFSELTELTLVVQEPKAQWGALCRLALVVRSNDPTHQLWIDFCVEHLQTKTQAFVLFERITSCVVLASQPGAGAYRTGESLRVFTHCSPLLWGIPWGSLPTDGWKTSAGQRSGTLIEMPKPLPPSAESNRHFHYIDFPSFPPDWFLTVWGQ